MSGSVLDNTLFQSNSISENVCQIVIDMNGHKSYNHRRSKYNTGDCRNSPWVMPISYWRSEK